LELYYFLRRKIKRSHILTIFNFSSVRSKKEIYKLIYRFWRWGHTDIFVIYILLLYLIQTFVSRVQMKNNKIVGKIT
jgi:hypothetical protein